MEDFSHQYILDSSYDPFVQIEDNQEYPKVLNWSYSDIVPNPPHTTYPHYKEDGPCLKW